MSNYDDTWRSEDFATGYMDWMVQKMRADNYTILFHALHDTPFEWHKDTPRDSDRETNGRYLRLRYVNESRSDLPDGELDYPCSFLEFLIALAYSIDDNLMYDPDCPSQPTYWFWEMMENIGLDVYDNETMEKSSLPAYYEIGAITDTVCKRLYNSDGSGGLFPLREPKMDQRKVETWYQANAYFMENYLEDIL